MNNRNTALADVLVRCPRCMGHLENVMVSDLPPAKWEHSTEVHIGSGIDVHTPTKKCKAIGECWEHGIQTIKVSAT